MADTLAATSGHKVAFILDGRNPVALDTTYPLVMLTEQACENIGLYCPHDFAWRCGDYGLYIARQQFPDETQFWILDHDVLITLPDEFFRFFADKPHDLLAAYYGPSQKDWAWYYHASGRDVKTYGFLFSIVRLSARAIDRLHTKRMQQSSTPHRRKLYPNDEGFVGTTLTNGDFCCADLNSFGPAFYDASTASALNPIQGETIAVTSEGPRIYHPVLWGDDYRSRTGAPSAPKRKHGPITKLRLNARNFISTITPW